MASDLDRASRLAADAAGLPFRDGAFDLAVAYMCLHDIDDMPRAVAEIARVLEPRGQLCAAIPHPVSTAGAFRDRDAVARSWSPAPIWTQPR